VPQVQPSMPSAQDQLLSQESASLPLASGHSSTEYPDPGLKVAASDNRSSKPLFFETPSQVIGGSRQRHLDADAESNKRSQRDRPRSSRRVLPWASHGDTDVSFEKGSTSASPHKSFNHPRAPPESLSIELQEQRRPVSSSPRSIIPAQPSTTALDEEVVVQTPSLVTVETAVRRTTSLPHTRSEGQREKKPHRSVLSEKERSFLREFGRRKRLSRLSSTMSTPNT
jgi:hypothetical protein